MFGPELATIRQSLSLTQRALAAEIGVTPAAVGRWERNTRPIPTPIAALLRLIAYTHDAGADWRGLIVGKPASTPRNG